ncbi:LysR substrate-binding domain-containing protein [Streptomyces sp. HUAS ZL42]|uniref:LysR substrate-binding domain-containing protein n=1 Tax=Streptomyces sp. HUAS ZL42 TaxID=3231715 RepID=UPI00345F0249
MKPLSRSSLRTPSNLEAAIQEAAAAGIPRPPSTYWARPKPKDQSAGVFSTYPMKTFSPGVPMEGLAPGFGHRVLVRDEIVALVASGRPQARRPALSLDELSATPLITYGRDSGLYPRLRTAFPETGVPFQPAYATNHVALQLELVAAGVGIALAAGASAASRRLLPVVTSYDSDAPIAEDGSLTGKFFAVRKALGAREPLRSSERLPTLPPTRVPLSHRADLLAGLRAVPSPTSAAPHPASFEHLGLDAGMVLHTAHPRIPAGEHRLILTDVRDRATVFSDGTLLGVAGPDTPELPVHGTGDVVRLEILVENLGRVDYGPGIGRHKGLLGPVLVDRRIVQGWDSTPVALQEWSAAELAGAVAAGPTTTHAGFAAATFHVDTPADNTVTALELERLGAVLELRDRPELGPPEEYVEEFD